MNNNNIAIIVVAYNRTNSLKRLLNSLNKIIVSKNEKVPLYISIDRYKTQKDKNDNENVLKIAEDFNWKYGDKTVDYKQKNLGLKEHILMCGNLTNIYKNIIVLEDDLVVSPLIICYAKQVISYYKNDKRIAGYGLYSYQKNQYANKPFYALNDGTDVYFMQNACSWGQIWTKEKWQPFYNWYNKNKNVKFENDNIPSEVCKWGEKSWLKWHIKYLIETNKFFVYPHVGLSTNFSEVGEHNCINKFGYQCTLYSNNNKDITFKFTDLDSSASIYDAYYENIKINKLLNVNNNIISNIYTTKNEKQIQNNLLLTTNIYNKKIIKKYGLLMYPYEQNIINNIEGNDLFLYDLSINDTNNHNHNNLTLFKYIYKLDVFSKKEIILLLKLSILQLIDKIKKHISK